MTSYLFITFLMHETVITIRVKIWTCRKTQLIFNEFAAHCCCKFIIHCAINSSKIPPKCEQDALFNVAVKEDYATSISGSHYCFKIREAKFYTAVAQNRYLLSLFVVTFCKLFIRYFGSSMPWLYILFDQQYSLTKILLQNFQLFFHFCRLLITWTLPSTRHGETSRICFQWTIYILHHCSSCIFLICEFRGLIKSMVMPSIFIIFVFLSFLCIFCKFSVIILNSLWYCNSN